jgi:hypothetical protein
MIIQLEGLLHFNLEFPKKGSRLPYNDKLLNGPNEQLWVRECILKDFLMSGERWTIESSKNEKYQGHVLYNIKVIDYEIVSNQYEIWHIALE